MFLALWRPTLSNGNADPAKEKIESVTRDHLINIVRDALQNPLAESVLGGTLYSEDAREQVAQVIVQELENRGVVLVETTLAHPELFKLSHT